MHYLVNAFSLNMVAREHIGKIRFGLMGTIISLKDGHGRVITRNGCNFNFDASVLLAYESAIGHADTALLLGVAFNRQTVKLVPGGSPLVAQYNGARLPEGATFDLISVHLDV